MGGWLARHGTINQMAHRTGHGAQGSVAVVLLKLLVVLRSVLLVADFLKNNCLTDGGWLARHGTID